MKAQVTHVSQPIKYMHMLFSSIIAFQAKYYPDYGSITF